MFMSPTIFETMSKDLLAVGPEKRKAVIRVEALFAIDCTRYILYILVQYEVKV